MIENDVSKNWKNSQWFDFYSHSWSWFISNFSLFVNNSHVMRIDFTLHKVAHLIKFHLDFFDEIDRQVIKRMWKIDQERLCYVWRFVTIDNTKKILIKLRQEIRFEIVKNNYSLSNANYDENIVEINTMNE